jgi:alpha-beta hydrolase superfamily lysophospholipase
MNKSTAERVSLTAEDDHRILVDIWPAVDPVFQIHLFHGLGEHPARYERFAKACNAANISIAAHAHRGHGENCAPDELGHYADDSGWDKLISDAALVQKHLVERSPDIPLVLLGHSMGSYIAQSFVIRGEGSASAMLLSGSSLAPRLQLRVAHWLAAFERWRNGPRENSALLNKLGFGDFNKAFEPNRTTFDWLSRDDAEVDKYLADPLCGGDSSNQLWHDLTGGLLEVSAKKSLRRIPADLQIMITGGSRDPVGGQKGLTLLANAYRKTGHNNVTLAIYDEGRHEMFNETNRDEFTADIIGWMQKAASTGTAQ